MGIQSSSSGPGRTEPFRWQPQNLGGIPVPCVHRPLLLGYLRSPKLPPGVGCSLQSLGPHGTLGACLLASLSCPGHRLSRVTQVCSSQEKKPSHLTREKGRPNSQLCPQALRPLMF